MTSELLKDSINTEIFENTVRELGCFDGKRKNCCSLSTHIFNSVILGLKYYDYAVNNDNRKELRILTSALFLHDCNKIVNSMYEEDFDYNTDECFDKYFEEDVLGVEEFLCDEDEEIGDYREDIEYLARSAEDYERQGSYSGDYTYLSDFVKFGDSMASRLARGDKTEPYLVDVSYFEFTSLSQPILNMICVHNIASIIESRGFTVLGYGTDFVAYISEDKTINFDDKFKETFKDNIFSEYIDQLVDFGIKVEWSSVDLGPLPYVPYSDEKKMDLISEVCSSKFLEQETAGFDPYDPSDKYVEKYLPFLIYDLYLSDKGVPSLDSLNDVFEEEKEEFGAKKAKISLLEELDDPKYFNMLDKHRESVRKNFLDHIDANFDYGSVILDSMISSFPDDSVESEQCFLCGDSSVELNDYSPGSQSIFGSRSYSRRTEYGSEGKKICSLCSLENSICMDLCDKNNTRYDSSFAFVFMDDFVAPLSLSSSAFVENCFSENVSDLVESSDGFDFEAYDKFFLPYNIFPCYYTDDNSKMSTMFNLIKLCENYGVRAVLSDPFTNVFDMDCVLYDYEPIDSQLVLDMFEIDRYEDRHSDGMSIERASHLLDVMEACSGSDRFEVIEEDAVDTILDTYVVNSDYPYNEKINKYVNKYHNTRYMSIKTIAEKGVEVYHYQKNSSYSRTKVFRECLEAFAEGLSHGMRDQQLIDHVSGQVRSSVEGTTDYGFNNEEVEEFVEATLEYLEEYYELDEVVILDNLNKIVNSYEFAYMDVCSNS